MAEDVKDIEYVSYETLDHVIYKLSKVYSGGGQSEEIKWPIPIEKGGSGATTADDAWTAFGGGSVGKLNTNSNAGTFLNGSGQWSTPKDTTYEVATTTAPGLMPALSASATQYLNGNGEWVTPKDTTYEKFAVGKDGLVPAPAAGDSGKYLKGDGTWTTVDNVPNATKAASADKLTTGHTITVQNGNAAGATSAAFDGTSNVTINLANLDAATLTTGTIPLARIPQGALERIVDVANQAARFALTTSQVQLGDTVRQLDTGVMYVVVDEGKLNQAAGYVEYAAGTALEAEHAKTADSATSANTANSATSASSATTANSAAKLTSPRSLKTKLDSTAAVTFDGSGDQNAIPVTGTLGIENGGTGATSARVANKNLFSDTYTADNVTADAQFAYISSAPNDTNGALRKVTQDTMWSWIKGKADSVYLPNGTVSIEKGGTGKTTAAEAWTNLGGGSVGKLNTGTDTTKYLRNDGQWIAPPNTNTWNAFKGASSTAAGTVGYVSPAPQAGDQNKFFRADGTWQIPTNTTYNVATTGSTGLMPALNGTATTYLNGSGQWTTPPNTTYGVTTTGGAGLAPQLNGTATTYLNGAGQWTTPPNTNTDTNVKQDVSSANTAYPILLKNGTGTGSVTTTALFDEAVTINPSTNTITATTFAGALSGNATTATTAGNVSGTVGIDHGGTGATTKDAAWTALGGGNVGKLTYSTDTTKYLRNDGTWQVPPNTNTWNAFKGATSTTAGTVGYVSPAPAAGDQNKFFRADGTWQIPTNTTYGVFGKSTSSAAGSNGLVPAPGAGADNRYLRNDGTWQVPPDNNTTYGVVSTSANGLAPKLTGSTTVYLNGNGAWTTPPNTTYGNFAGSTAGLVPTSSGGTANYLRADGQWATPPNTNTDTNVTQNHSTNNAEYPVLLKNGTGTGNITSTSIFDGDVTVNASTGAITAPRYQFASTAGSWITGKTYAPITDTTQNSASSYHPIMRWTLNNGNVWNFGTYQNVFGFYGFAANRTDNGTDWTVTVNGTNGQVTAPQFNGALNGNASTATSAGTCTGNAASATKLQNAQTISLTGNVTGSASFAGNAACSISTTLADSAVATGKIANNAVTTAKIADGNVTLAKLNSAVSTLYVGATQPTDSHVQLWIDTSS